MNEFLNRIIPSSNRLEAAFASGAARTGLLESGYDSGFVGAFGDYADMPSWISRAHHYLRDEFFAETQGPHEFGQISDDLANGDGEFHFTDRYAMEAWIAGGKVGVEPFSCFQDYGSCVDASLAELETALFGYRAAKMPEVREEYRHPAAWYKYANRGYCSDGWNGFGAATQAKRMGAAFRIKYQLGERAIDFTDDDENETLVARTWCRGGAPAALIAHCSTNHAYDPTAITSFGDGGLKELKKLFAAGGCLHFSGTRTSGGPKPFTWGSTGPHMMTAYGYDDSDQFRQFCRDVIKVPSRDNDFPVRCGQTWGAGWRGECASQYWPSWWGPKPQGSWVCWASEFVRGLSLDVAYLPRVKGFASGGPVPVPDYPSIDGEIFGDTLPSGRVVIRGELTSAGKKYIVTPKGDGTFRVVPKPIL